MVGVVMFAGMRGGNVDDNVGDILIWGTIEKRDVREVLQDLSNRDDRFSKVKYEEKDELEFDSIFTEALAEGEGPDIFLLPQSKIYKHQNKIVAIPYETFSLRDFKDYFIEEGELYLTDDGILALPFVIDPLVMYWNRTIFSRLGLVEVPRYWDNFFTFATNMTERDEYLNILTSAVAFGEYGNIKNAKEIISTLIMQTGNPIITRTGDIIKVVLSGFDDQSTATESAVRFYSEFSNPVKEIYSWNKSMPNSQNVFLAGDLALYFGFASELGELQEKNPNLNFDVALIPQTIGLKNNINFGKMYGLAISKSAENIKNSYDVMIALIKGESLTYLNEITKLPPVSRILLSQEPRDPYQNIFYKAAVSSKAFLDLDEEATDLIYQDMIESIVSGRRKISEAIDRAGAEMTTLIKK